MKKTIFEPESILTGLALEDFVRIHQPRPLPLHFLIEDMLYRGDVVVLEAPKRHGKTTFLRNLVYSGACLSEFLFV